MSRPRRAADGKPNPESTRDALLRITVAHLDESGEEGIRLESILAEADCSPSSLYHHFGNLRGLIDDAQIVRFSRNLAERNQMVRDRLATVETRDELVEFVVEITRKLLSNDGKGARSARINALGSTYKRPDFAKRMGLALQENCDDLADALRAPQLRGLIPASVDRHALALWFQSIFFGRALVELLDNDAIGNQWNDITVRSVLVALLGPEGLDAPM